MTAIDVNRLLETTIAQDAFGGLWTVAREIGSGSYGTVYQIQQPIFGTVQSAALKVITVPNEETRNSCRMFMNDRDYSDYCESLKTALSDEHNKLRSLSGNTHVVAYQGHCFIEQDDGWIMLMKMELLEGIQERMQSIGFSRQDIIKLGIHICKALELCHNSQHKLIHRDIKPDNIFVSSAGDYKLGDFGVSKDMTATLSIMSKQGTSLFMAPEVYTNQGSYDYTVDIYSLGLVMYQYMNNNRPPFGGNRKFTMDLPKESLERRMSGEDLPLPVNENGALADIVLKACSYRAEDRYQTAAEMRSALEALVDPTDPKVYLEAGGNPPQADICIRFLNQDQQVITETLYFKGDRITVPKLKETTEINGYRYTFSGWSPEVRPIAHSSTDYSPVYQKEKLACIRFLSEDQHVISSKLYVPGERVEIPKAPARCVKSGAKYQFNGWNPPVAEIAGDDAEYTATYRALAGARSSKRLFLGGCITFAVVCLLLCVILLVRNPAQNTNDPSLNGARPPITETPSDTMDTDAQPVLGTCRSGHSWQPATCTRAKTCSVCGATDGSIPHHSWIAATCTTPKTCSVCKITEGVVSAHRWLPATCTAPKTCSGCNATEGETIPHQWVTAQNSSFMSCTLCGEMTFNSMNVSPDTATTLVGKSHKFAYATNYLAIADSVGHLWIHDTYNEVTYDTKITDVKSVAAVGHTFYYLTNTGEVWKIAMRYDAPPFIADTTRCREWENIDTIYGFGDAHDELMALTKDGTLYIGTTKVPLSNVIDVQCIKDLLSPTPAIIVRTENGDFYGVEGFDLYSKYIAPDQTSLPATQPRKLTFSQDLLDMRIVRIVGVQELRFAVLEKDLSFVVYGEDGSVVIEASAPVADMIACDTSLYILTTENVLYGFGAYASGVSMTSNGNTEFDIRRISEASALNGLYAIGPYGWGCLAIDHDFAFWHWGQEESSISPAKTLYTANGTQFYY